MSQGVLVIPNEFRMEAINSMVSQEREQSTSVTSQDQDIDLTSDPVNLTADDSADTLQDEDFDMAALLDESEASSSVESGQVITGTVLKVTGEDVVIDIGSKSEGVVPLEEFEESGEETQLQPGTEIDVMVVKREGRDGLPVLSRRRAKQMVARRNLREAFKNKQPVNCLIKQVVKGGFEVDINGLRGFIPFSQMGPGARTKDEQQGLIGQTIEAKILEMKNKRDLILSQRVLLDEKRERLRQETMGSLEIGKWFKGVVKNLTDFGAFIDLGGVDGLLHVKDMSWGHVAHPRERVNVGDEIEVLVLNIEGERISLGLKQKTPDPWLTVTEKYPPGSEVVGKVTSLTKYGAFVELEEGVEGLIHLSEMSWTKRVRHPSEMLNEGDELKVKVLGVDTERKRISLSLKQTTVDPWTLAKANYPPGTVIEGEVTGMTDFGAFVRLPEGVDGMIHVSDMSWIDKINHPKQVVKKGDMVKAKVLEIDPSQQRISLGMKQMDADPWDAIAKRYKVGTVHQVKIVRMTDFGAFVELEEGVEGLAPNSHLVTERGQRPEDIVKVGDIVSMKVIKMDRPNRKISLSLKEQVKEEERQEVQQYLAESTAAAGTLGEMLGEQMRALMDQAPDEEEAVAEEPPAVTTDSPVAQEELAAQETPAVDQPVEENMPPVEPTEQVPEVSEETVHTPTQEPEPAPPEEQAVSSDVPADEQLTAPEETPVEPPVEQEPETPAEQQTEAIEPPAEPPEASSDEGEESEPRP